MSWFDVEATRGAILCDLVQALVFETTRHAESDRDPSHMVSLIVASK